MLRKHMLGDAPVTACHDGRQDGNELNDGKDLKFAVGLQLLICLAITGP